MKINKMYVALGLMIAFAFFFELTAHADESMETTKITFNVPVQIPGQVLPPGTYLFQRADSDTQNVIQIFNADRTHVISTVQTVSAERQEPADDTVITVAEPGSGSADVLVNWFYPGSTIGHQFIYSKHEEQEIAHAKLETFEGSQSMPSGEAAGE